MDFFSEFSREVDQFVRVCHGLAADKYVTSHGGNLAWRLAPGVILITPTRTWKGSVTPSDLVFIDADGNRLAGAKQPTGEKFMYLKFFRERADVVSVLHCHPPACCALAVMKGKNWLERPLYPETTTEVGPVPIVPYAEPLTQELADKFTPYLQRYNAFLMQNHGLVLMTRGDIEWTYWTTELLESTAQSVLMAAAAGQGIREFTREEVRRLGNVMTTRELPLFGAPGVNNSLEDLYFPSSRRKPKPGVRHKPIQRKSPRARVKAADRASSRGPTARRASSRRPGAKRARKP